MTPMNISGSIDRPKAFLPWWTSWGGQGLLLLFALVLGAGLAHGLSTVYQNTRRRAEGLHWTEAARESWAPRAASGYVFVIVVVVIWALEQSTLGPLTALKPPQFLALTALAGCAGMKLGSNFHPPESNWRSVSWRNRWRAWCLAQLLGGLAGPLLLISVMLTSEDFADPMAWLPFLTSIAVYAWLAMQGTSWSMRRFGLADPVHAELEDRAREICQQEAVRLRGIYSTVYPSINALALLWSQEIILMGGIQAHLKPDELDAVLVHEARHLSEQRRTRWIRLLHGGRFLLIPLLIPLAGELSWIAIVAAGIGMLVVSRQGTKLSHRLELEADEAARNPLMATGLEAIHRHNGVPVVHSKAGSHPSLVTRMQEAGVNPSWPTPAPPSAWNVGRWLAMMLLAAFLGQACWKGLVRSIGGTADQSVSRALTVVSLKSGADDSLIDLGSAYHREGRVTDAHRAFAAAVEWDASPWCAAEIADRLYLLEDGRVNDWRSYARELAADWSADERQELEDWMTERD